MQIKMIMRYLTHFHITDIQKKEKKISDCRCWQGGGEIGNFEQCWWDCKIVQLLLKTALRFLKQFKIALPYDPVISFPGTHPK